MDVEILDLSVCLLLDDYRAIEWKHRLPKARVQVDRPASRLSGIKTGGSLAIAVKSVLG